MGAEPVDFETLMRESDFLSLHVPLDTSTRRIIHADALSLMKPTAYLVNTARGPVLEEAALYRALVEGRIAGAGLDVFEVEPLEPTNPLLALPNVVATPHSLPRTWESTGRTTRMIQEAVLEILEGHLPDTILNPTVKIKGMQL